MTEYYVKNENKLQEFYPDFSGFLLFNHFISHAIHY